MFPSLTLTLVEKYKLTGFGIKLKHYFKTNVQIFLRAACDAWITGFRFFGFCNVLSFCSNCIVWNLDACCVFIKPVHVANSNSTNSFKNNLDRFWSYQEVYSNFRCDITGTGNRSLS